MTGLSTHAVEYPHLHILLPSVIFMLRYWLFHPCTLVAANTRTTAQCCFSSQIPRTSILINNVPSVFLHAGSRSLQPSPGLILRCCAMADTAVPVAKAEGGKEKRVTLKNAAGLTLVGTFYDAGTLARLRRCYKLIHVLCSLFLMAQLLWAQVEL